MIGSIDPPHKTPPLSLASFALLSTLNWLSLLIIVDIASLISSSVLVIIGIIIKTIVVLTGFRAPGLGGNKGFLRNPASLWVRLNLNIIFKGSSPPKIEASPQEIWPEGSYDDSMWDVNSKHGRTRDVYLGVISWGASLACLLARRVLDTIFCVLRIFVLKIPESRFRTHRPPKGGSEKGIRGKSVFKWLKSELKREF